MEWSLIQESGELARSQELDSLDRCVGIVLFV